MALFKSLLLLSIAGTVLAAPQFDKYVLTPNTSVSQVGIGSFIWPLATNYLSNRYADWIMDFENLRLRFTLGNPSQTGYTQLFSFSSISYVVELNPATNSLYCFAVPFNFQYVLGVYMYPYVRYLGDAVANNQTYHMYAGLSPDPLTQTNIANLAFVNAANTAFTFMPILSNNGFIYYTFNNVTMGTPDSSYYTLPSICNVSSVACTPACGRNAQCVNQTCVCFKGYSGNAIAGCVPTVSTQQLQNTVVNVTYDQYTLTVGADAVSQTCTGTYNNPTTGSSIYSAWVQNLQNQSIRWDVGRPNVSGSVSYYFLNSTGYTVTYMTNSTMCNTTNQMNFTQALYNMFYPTMRYMGVNTSYNNVSNHIYVGTGVPNPNTPATSMIKYISTSGSQFYFLAMLNTQGYTYYDYPNVTLGTPASSWFVVPAVCGAESSNARFGQVIFAFFAGLAVLLLRWQ